MGKRIECEIDSVRVSLTNQDRIIILKEKDSNRFLPIWIGLYEAESITIALQKISVARPLTHDLMILLLNALDVQLVCVEISALEAETFYGNLVIEQDGERKYVDCRPSDAIAVAVRAHVPIFVDEGVLNKAGILPEAESEEPSPTEAEMEEADEDADYSAFKDFLDQLSRDDNQNPDLSDEDDPDDVPF